MAKHLNCEKAADLIGQTGDIDALHRLGRPKCNQIMKL